MKSQGLNRQYRMLKHHQFSALRQEPCVKRVGGLVLFYKPNGLSYHRLGITMKGRCSSVERVKMKREIREWFRLLKSNRKSAVDIENESFDINLFIDLGRNQRLLQCGIGGTLAQTVFTFSS